MGSAAILQYLTHWNNKNPHKTEINKNMEACAKGNIRKGDPGLLMLHIHWILLRLGQDNLCTDFYIWPSDLCMNVSSTD